MKESDINRRVSWGTFRIAASAAALWALAAVASGDPPAEPARVNLPVADHAAPAGKDDAAVELRLPVEWNKDPLAASKEIARRLQALDTQARATGKAAGEATLTLAADRDLRWAVFLDAVIQAQKRAFQPRIACVREENGRDAVFLTLWLGESSKSATRPTGPRGRLESIEVKVVAVGADAGEARYKMDNAELASLEDLAARIRDAIRRVRSGQSVVVLRTEGNPRVQQVITAFNVAVGAGAERITVEKVPQTGRP